MDEYLALERAAHDGAFGRENHALPTPAACEADDYRKGRVRLHGLDIAIENPYGSIREGQAADGRKWANRMAAHYGEFVNTKGADGDPVDVFIGPYPESKRVWVINQSFNGKFDEHKAMLGFTDADSAKAAYLNSYARDWKGLGSMVAMSLSEFKQWLGTNPQAPAVEKPVEKILWSGDAPRTLTFDALLYQIRRRDADGLIFDAVTEGEVLQDAEEVLTLDAMTSPYQQLPKRAQLLMNMMNRVGDLQVAGFTITKPYRVRGIINIAVIYRLADDQTITVYFHTGGGNIRVQPNDELISWKWMLNKLDVTIAVAPEQGVELDLRTVARRLVQLAIKNSATFAKQNAKKAETLANIDALKGEITAAEMELAGLNAQIAAREAEALSKVTAEQAREAARKLPNEAIGVLRSMGVSEEVILEAFPYDSFDGYVAASPEIGKPIIAQRKALVRSALRQLGWEGDMFRPLSLGMTNASYVVNFTERPDLRIELGRWAGAEESGVEVYDDDLLQTADSLAAQITDAARADGAKVAEIDDDAQASGQPPVGTPSPDDVPEATETPGEFVIPGDGSGIAVSVDGPVTPAVAEVVAAAVEAEQISSELPIANDPDVINASDPTVVAPELIAALGDVPPAGSTEAGEPATETPIEPVASLLTYDLSFLQSVIDGEINPWADGLAERIESVMQAHPDSAELQAKATCAIDAYTHAVIEAARASMDAIQVPDPLHDMPPPGQRANESQVQTPEQKAAATVAVRQQNGNDWPTPPTSTPVPEKSSLDTALVEPGNPTGVLTPPNEPVTPEQAVGETGGVPVPEAPVATKLAEQPAAPDMPSIDTPEPVLDTAVAEVAQIEPTESGRESARLIQIQQNGQSERVLAAAKAEVGAELLATEPNQPIPVPDVEPAPEIKPVPETMPHPEAPAVTETNPLPVQGDPSTPFDASAAGVPQAVTDVPPIGPQTTTQVPDPLHDTPPMPARAVVDMPLDPAQKEADRPNEVVQREADRAYLDSVIDGSTRGESGRIGDLFQPYEMDAEMLDKWREAVSVFTQRMKS